MTKPRRPQRPFPTKDEILAFVRESPDAVGKREIARAFRIRGSERGQLRDLLKELQQDGQIGRMADQRLGPPERLPRVQVIEVTGSDADGDLLATPAVWRGKGSPPVIYLAPGKRGHPALAPGERVLARLKQLDKHSYEARVISLLGRAPRQLLGVYAPEVEDGRLRSTDRRAKSDYILRPDDAAGAEAGELVLAEVKQRHPRRGLSEARVVERLGRGGDPRVLSLIAIHEREIPNVFSEAALAEAQAAGPLDLETQAGKGQARREDLRGLALVTIDGADARDFDDAVWAEADQDPNNPGGWHLLVAIADVAHYVRPDRALDRAAYERGNSVYFPDRVVPMLPEALSNGWCSLKPAQARPCLAVHLWIDAAGGLKRHRFVRGVMRSTARLTYEQIQAAHDGDPDQVTEPLLAAVIDPLYGAYGALAAARKERGVLELEIPERRVRLDTDGKVIAIEPAPRLDSHRLIEEFMVTANVAAAEVLERRKIACLYRVHDAPDPQKLEALRQLLKSFGLKLARGQVIRPRDFNRILANLGDPETLAMVSNSILRSQSQAVYQPRNIGHFGLALRRYTHFTSPIRRYSDLVVHRALITALDLGEGGLTPHAEGGIEALGQHLSMTERRAQAAERDTLDRFAAAYLEAQVGAVFPGCITGVTHFGLFVRLNETGAEGLVPASSLPDDYYAHDPKTHSLIGRRWGRIYRLGDGVEAKLAEANPITGGLIFALPNGRHDRAPGSDPAPAKRPGSRPCVPSGDPRNPWESIEN